MAKTKVHINVAHGLSGITIQRYDGHSYEVTDWKDLTLDEQKQICQLFQNATIVYSSNLESGGVKKKCNKCGKMLPLTDFYEHINAKGINIGRGTCKKCIVSMANERNKKYRENRTEEQLENQREYNRNYYREHRSSGVVNKSNKNSKSTKKVETKPEVEAPPEKYCINCIHHDYCFPETYPNESNFANTCKKYDDKNDK
jgi:hypothetical protein